MAVLWREIWNKNIRGCCGCGYLLLKTDGRGKLAYLPSLSARHTKLCKLLVFGVLFGKKNVCVPLKTLLKNLSQASVWNAAGKLAACKCTLLWVLPTSRWNLELRKYNWFPDYRYQEILNGIRSLLNSLPSLGSPLNSPRSSQPGIGNPFSSLPIPPGWVFPSSHPAIHWWVSALRNYRNNVRQRNPSREGWWKV